MKVAEDHLNSGGALHGGVTATLVDHVSSLAIMANDAPPGISVDLNTRLVLSSVSVQPQFSLCDLLQLFESSLSW